MDELIEYLRGVAENANLPQYMRDRLTEAAAALEAAHADIDGMRETIMAEHDARIESEAALEAAREDADKVIFRIEKYANDQERDPIVVPSSRLRAWASDLRAAIDQARGKGVADEA